MNEILNSLERAFCEDCTERMKRVADRIAANFPPDRGALDEMHQEFDTLFGGARAVHLPELEHYFRSMARYARFLRNCLTAGAKIDAQAWQDMQDGIRIAQRCNADSAACLKRCNSERVRLLQSIENRIDKGEGQ